MKYFLEKQLAWVKWALAVAIYFVLFIPSLLLYPILFYPTRGAIRFFWYGCGKIGKVISFLGFIFLNDPEENGVCDDYGTEQYRKSLGYTQPVDELTWYQKLWISYRWSGIRNWAWNTHRFLKPKYNNHSKYTGFDCISNIKYNSGPSGLDFCVLKYKFSDGTEADNFGDFIDYEKSILGKNFVYYRVNGVLYFRYSKAWVDGNIAREIQLGTNGRRFKLRIKRRKLI